VSVILLASITFVSIIYYNFMTTSTSCARTNSIHIRMFLQATMQLQLQFLHLLIFII